MMIYPEEVQFVDKGPQAAYQLVRKHCVPSSLVLDASCVVSSTSPYHIFMLNFLASLEPYAKLESKTIAMKFSAAFASFSLLVVQALGTLAPFDVTHPNFSLEPVAPVQKRPGIYRLVRLTSRVSLPFCLSTNLVGEVG